QGLRPGKVVVLNDADLDVLESELYPDQSTSDSIEHILTVLQSSDSSELEARLSQLYQQQGMEPFITETVIPLLYTVGERWAKGKLQIFEEHLLSEVLTRFLNSEISKLQKNTRKPRVLLATLPGEEHTLGLLMFAALLSSRNICVTNLGGEVPLDQIVLAVERLNADVLGITFSGAYQYENIRSNMNQLRDSIPANVDIWLGGEGVKRMRKLPKGVTRFTSFDKLPF
ncbi:MAG: cobalamin-dependent protein, partial [Gammaproteobacteria bacterium]|nr:cobalamin-dependent protein [Gammaproteobacteria bacterium]